MLMKWADLEAGDVLRVKRGLTSEQLACRRCLRLEEKYLYHIRSVDILNSGKIQVRVEERNEGTYIEAFSIILDEDGIIICSGCNGGTVPVFEIVSLRED